jgi:predicted MFS family arabinose efflux permease
MGAAIGLIVGGALTEYASWRWTLLVNTPIALLVAVAALPLLRDSRAEGDRRYDVPGAVIATAGLVSLVYGFTEASTRSWTAPLTLALIGLAVVLLGAFAAWERRAANPLLPLRVVTDRNRGGSFLAFLLATLGMFGTFLFLSYYFQSVLGYSALKAGFAFLPFPLGIITSATIASRTLPRLGPRLVAGVGFSMGVVGLLLLTRLTPHAAYLTQVVPSQLLISLGMGQVFVPLSSTALVGVPNHDAGVASALVNTMQQIGGSLGIAFLNTIATTATAHYAAAHGGLSSAAVVHGFTTAFWFSVGIFVVAAVAVVSLVQRDAGGMGGPPAYDDAVQPSAGPHVADDFDGWDQPEPAFTS